MEAKVMFNDEDLKVLSSVFKILSEVSRLKILRCLAEGERCVTDIINATGLMQANVSKQLKIMQKAGFVECRPAGLQRFYRIVNPFIIEICKTTCKHKS
ncbi:MAG: ArsR/SmtB family transcription factor [Candidatus Kapaibacteriota bacterium]